MKVAWLIAISLISVNSYALSLEGTWKSDAESTITFNQANAKLSEQQKIFFSELLGKLTVTYKNGIAYNAMPPTKVTVKGIQKDFDGFRSKTKYRIIAQNKNTVVLMIESKDESEITLLKFENDDNYWVYLPISSSIWSQLHIREYFVRIQ